MIISALYGALFFRGFMMLSTKALLFQNTLPSINDVSLSLYKEFFLDYLLPIRFEYFFEDGDIIPVEFQIDRFRHILGIQHIDKTTTDENIFYLIDNGLSFNSWKTNPRQKKDSTT